MKRAIFLTAILLMALWPASLPAQSWIEKRADMLYENLSYSKAANAYESLYQRHPQNGKYIQRLAYCYEKMLNYKKALLYYSYLVQTDQCTLSDYYEYSQLLRIDGDMEASRVWLDKYLQLAPDDKRAISQYNQLNDLISIRDKIKNIEIREVKGNTYFSDMCPAFYNDQLVFSSARDSFSMVKNEFKWSGQPFLRLFETAADPQADFTHTSHFSKKLDTRVHEGPVCFSSDYKTIYFTRNSTSGAVNKKSPGRINNLKIFISTFNGKAWSEPVDFPYNSNLYSVGHPALSSDNKTLYFISDMQGGFGATDIYKSELVNGQWLKPENLGPTINTEGKEMFPSIDKEGTLYFSSDGRPGLGCLDIYAARTDDQGKYMIAYFGSPLNSRYDDFGFIANLESSSGYFTSNRPGGAGDDDIYSFKVNGIELLVTSKMERDGKIMPNTKIYLKGADGQIITSATTGQDGLAEFSIKPGQQYQIYAENAGYGSETMPVVISRPLFGLEHKAELLLRHTSPFLTLKVIDHESGEIIPLAIVDVLEGEYDESSLDNGNGIVRMKLNNSTDYVFNVTAEGYIPNPIKYSSVDKEPGDYSLTVEMDKLSKGKLFTLKNLYYDLNKADIRPDAALVLDEMVRMLHENPDVHLAIGSHTDSRADADYNYNLSLRRSESVVAYLIGKGISSDRLVAKGFGESQLINKCADGVNCPEQEHQANRRTVLEVLDKDHLTRPLTSL